MALRDLLRSPFSFLGAAGPQEERLAKYVLREHDRGRSLSEILADPYIRNRTSEDERGRLLDRPEIVHALGDSAIEDARRILGGAGR